MGHYILTECKLLGCDSVSETVCNECSDVGDPNRYHPLFSSRIIGGRDTPIGGSDTPTTGTVGRDRGREATVRGKRNKNN